MGKGDYPLRSVNANRFTLRKYAVDLVHETPGQDQAVAVYMVMIRNGTYDGADWRVGMRPRRRRRNYAYVLIVMKSRAVHLQEYQ